MIDPQLLLSLSQALQGPQNGMTGQTPGIAPPTQGGGSPFSSIFGMLGKGGGTGMGEMFSGGASGTGSMGAAGLYAGAGQLAGGLSDSLLKDDEGILGKGEAKLGGALKGAGTGAAIGSIIPGVGTLAGAGVGALAGGLLTKSNEREVRNSQMGKNAGAIKDAKAQASLNSNSIMQNYGGYGNNIPGLYALGGPVDPPTKKGKKLSEADKAKINAHTGISFTDAGANQLFERTPRLDQNPPEKFNLGRFQDKGFYDVTTNGTNYSVNRTDKNPYNYDAYKEQLEYFQSLNPDAVIEPSRTSYSRGGFVPPEYKVEGEEVMYAPDVNPPTTDKNGKALKIAKNTYKFKGDKHSAKSGGIGVKGGNTPFIGNAGEAQHTGFVFSDKLKVPKGINYLKGL